ncbi:putative receptor-like protein 8 [Rutidosis leptorrhynchoides]|uniref:putative receptor-like protein 8 n=1 Tax=Rutidosis leptorrhynchoides TaxID=125765 RepID=UPI003A9948E2
MLLDNNRFTGVLTKEINTQGVFIMTLDISGNLFSGVIPGWITNQTSLYALVIRDNMFEGQFPCGTASFSHLDISQNNFSGSVPSCLGMYTHMEHLHLDSNSFTGSIPESFRNLTNLLTLDMGNNKLSGNIPQFLGELSSLRILLLRNTNFAGSIPKQLCQLSYLRLLNLSSNFLSGSIPDCLQNITQSGKLSFLNTLTLQMPMRTFYPYESVIVKYTEIHGQNEIYERQDEVEFLTKSRHDSYKGGILDHMSGLDLSCNNLTGEIPQELGMLVDVHAVNLSHNQLTGPIPRSFSNLANIESLDISSNHLSGNVPLELIRLNYLSNFIVANNNLSGSLPQMKGQFGTFPASSYEGNPFLCGPPLAKSCAPAKTNSTLMMAPEENEEKWYDVDMVSFSASLVSTWFVFLMGFFGILYINPNWRRRWF